MTSPYITNLFEPIMDVFLLYKEKDSTNSSACKCDSLSIDFLMIFSLLIIWKCDQVALSYECGICWLVAGY